MKKDKVAEKIADALKDGQTQSMKHVEALQITLNDIIEAQNEIGKSQVAIWRLLNFIYKDKENVLTKAREICEEIDINMDVEETDGSKN